MGRFDIHLRLLFFFLRVSFSSSGVSLITMIPRSPVAFQFSALATARALLVSHVLTSFTRGGDIIGFAQEERNGGVYSRAEASGQPLSCGRFSF
ncbi:hypothetical protein B0T24DRAFT_75618 [Lasiosphaeria ovina]|uniref:Uncharacterized protein n=1 Tax=Lasiosphaeria ovina TaxID=92902 RepID=A0AAE0TYM1_9PEZI|nr:hypothetical protein B0T24DRAFT_75618 [Lasiosphaeria ovina]